MAKVNNAKRCMNILLLGETGTGKSTLVNAFANYSAHRTFDEAIKGQEICLIPTTISFTDDIFDTKTVKVGGEDDRNECLEAGESATMACKSYVIDISDSVQVRWIDTAGFNATQGKRQDEESVEDIVDYAVQYKTIDAIAIVLKANVPRLSSQFQQCLQLVIANIDEKNIIKNFIFIFTHGTKPGNSLTLLKKFSNSLKEWPKDVQFNKQTIFCFENSPCLDLWAVKKGLSFNNDKTETEAMWSAATDEFQRLINAVFQLTPHDVSDTLSERKAFAFIKDISLCIGLIVVNIDENKQQLVEWSEKMKMENVNVNEVCVKEIKIEVFERPLTLCVSMKEKSSCALKYTLNNGRQVKYFRLICCRGCWLPFGKLRLCDAFHMISGKCGKCKCKVSEHELIHYTASDAAISIAQCYNAIQANDANGAEATTASVLAQLAMEERHIVEAASKLVKFYVTNKKTSSKMSDERITMRLELFVNESDKIKAETMSIEDVKAIKSQLISLPIYGHKFSMFCNAKVEAKKKRDVKVSIINKTFRIFK